MQTTVRLGVLLGALLATGAGAVERHRIEGADRVLAERFAPLREGDLAILDLSLPAEPSLVAQFAGAEEGDPAHCAFGPLESLHDTLEVPTGDNHFLLSVRLGYPERHAANLASCEYRADGPGPQHFVRLRGCFLTFELSIPTARHVLLHPLPAHDCFGRE